MAEKKRKRRNYRTGEDIDMLNERRHDRSSSYSSNSTKYKDHIDGA